MMGYLVSFWGQFSIRLFGLGLVVLGYIALLGIANPCDAMGLGVAQESIDEHALSFLERAEMLQIHVEIPSFSPISDSKDIHSRILQKIWACPLQAVQTMEHMLQAPQGTCIQLPALVADVTIDLMHTLDVQALQMYRQRLEVPQKAQQLQNRFSMRYLAHVLPNVRYVTLWLKAANALGLHCTGGLMLQQDKGCFFVLKSEPQSYSTTLGDVMEYAMGKDEFFVVDEWSKFQIGALTSLLDLPMRPSPSHLSPTHGCQGVDVPESTTE